MKRKKTIIHRRHQQNLSTKRQRPVFRSATRRPKRKNQPGLTRYALNPRFEFANELRNLILKSSPAEKEEMLQRLQKLGRVKLAIITGIFINREKDENIPTDLFMVADDLDHRKLSSFLRFIEAEVGGEIRFVVMENEEFKYRFSMFDRFVRMILEGPHEKLINKLGI